MGYERSAWIALVSTLLLILLVEAQDGVDGVDGINGVDGVDGVNGVDGVTTPITPISAIEPIQPTLTCAGTRCPSYNGISTERSCCKCESNPTGLHDVIERCAYCPSYCWCWPSITGLLNLTTCCPAGWMYDPVTERCKHFIASISSNVVSSNCDRMYLSITADDVINDLFLDGVSYASMVVGRWWTSVKTFEIPANTKVIATNCSDTAGVVAGLLASTTNDYLLTSTAWKCTSQTDLPDNWMQTTFDDQSPSSGWENAVFQDMNVASNIHKRIDWISSNASWIWTQNDGRPNYAGPIDTPVYCRGYFPTACTVNSGCDLAYGNCSNLCSREQSGTCCGCELNSFGPSMVCNCCPKGYKCCGKYLCCPDPTTCQLDGRCLGVLSPVLSAIDDTSCSDGGDRTLTDDGNGSE